MSETENKDIDEISAKRSRKMRNLNKKHIKRNKNADDWFKYYGRLLEG